MNLYEAKKSGKNFRLPGMNKWFSSVEYSNTHQQFLLIDADDINAGVNLDLSLATSNNWELKYAE